jgi:hypothetical protein
VAEHIDIFGQIRGLWSNAGSAACVAEVASMCGGLGIAKFVVVAIVMCIIRLLIIGNTTTACM